MALQREQWRFHPANFGNSRIGPVIASAATITPTHPIHHVSGTAAIVNITAPEDPTRWQGELTLIADAIWTWTAAGNIGIAGTVTAALKQVKFVYDPATAKWYPDKVA